MKKLFSTILVLGFLLSGNAYAETVQEKIDNYIYNNLSFEYTECQHYLIIMSEALKTNNPDPAIVKNYVENAKLVSDLAFMYGEEAGMSIEAMIARSKLISNKMVMLRSMEYPRQH